MDSSKNLSDSVIFSKGEKVEKDYFKGSKWMKTLVSDDGILNCSISNVTFEPGARNNWHKHPGGQVLLITGGKGYYQEEGKPVLILHDGDVVKIKPEVKHWHGAMQDSWFTHLSIRTNVQKGDTEWLEPVAVEEYNNLKID